MPTANERLFDLFVQQQVNLQRMSRTEGQALLRLLNESDAALNRFVRLEGESFTMRRLARVQAEIRRFREPAMRALGSRIQDLMTGTASQEMGQTISILERVVPVEINFASPSPVAVREAVTGTPFGDPKRKHLLGTWIETLSSADENRIMGAIQAGVVRGSTVPELTAAVGEATGMTRVQAEAISRTAINHASNTARNAVFNENAEVISALRWVSTLDGRTSPVCRANDGLMRPADGRTWEGVPEPHLESALDSPPAHVRCRSIMISVLDHRSIADQLAGHRRATVRDTRTGRQQQVDFERQARRRYGQGWRDAPAATKAQLRRQVRQEWARENIGSVPGTRTYGEWLQTQPKGFVRDVLGNQRAEWFLEGKLKMTEFVDRFGKPLTLKELAAKHDLS